MNDALHYRPICSNGINVDEEHSIKKLVYRCFLVIISVLGNSCTSCQFEVLFQTSSCNNTKKELGHVHVFGAFYSSQEIFSTPAQAACTCSKSTMETPKQCWKFLKITPEWRHWRHCSVVLIVSFEQTSLIALVFSLRTLSK